MVVVLWLCGYVLLGEEILEEEQIGFRLFTSVGKTRIKWHYNPLQISPIIRKKSEKTPAKDSGRFGEVSLVLSYLVPKGTSGQTGHVVTICIVLNGSSKIGRS